MSLEVSEWILFIYYFTTGSSFSYSTSKKLDMRLCMKATYDPKLFNSYLMFFRRFGVTICCCDCFEHYLTLLELLHLFYLFYSQRLETCTLMENWPSKQLNSDNFVCRKLALCCCWLETLMPNTWVIIIWVVYSRCLSCSKENKFCLCLLLAYRGQFLLLFFSTLWANCSRQGS